jgi:hypothetical protein
MRDIARLDEWVGGQWVTVFTGKYRTCQIVRNSRERSRAERGEAQRTSRILAEGL